MRRLTSGLLSFVLLTQVVTSISAKPKGDWNAIKALANRPVAVKTKDGETVFGLIQSVDDVGISVLIADHDDLTRQELTFRREEVTKVWRATLRFGEKNVLKGALIGVGVGLGTAFLTAAIQGARGSSDPPVGLGLFPFYGAGAGAGLGTLWKKGHKKNELVYST